jgi:signal transduction histidine kinase
MSMALDSLKQPLAGGESAARELAGLEGELMAIGRPPVNRPSVIDVNELVAQLAGVFERVLGAGIRTTLHLDAADPMVEAEAVQLECVFLNLAANSHDAMPNGGEFTVQTMSVDREVGMPPRRQRFVHVTVKDTGYGLFREARVRACDPFFSTRDGGADLGLTSAAMIARRYRGWLHIESSDSGTSIHIHLPALTPTTG